MVTKRERNGKRDGIVGVYATGFMICEPWPGPVTVHPNNGEPYVEYDAYADEEEERLGPPYVYYHSGVMPHKDAERKGSVELGYIGGHIWRTDPDVKPQANEDFPHPYLRLGVQEKAFTTNGETVVIDREQAKAMHEFLGEWLKWTEESEAR